MIDAFGAGVYLLFGIIHLDHLRRAGAREGHGWLASAAFAALVVDLTGIWLRRHGGPPSVGALNLLAVGVATAALSRLATVWARRPAGAAWRVAAALALVILPVASATGSATLVAAGIVLCGALLARSLAVAGRVARLGDPDSRILAGGFATLLLCLLADVAMELRLLPRLYGLPIAGFISLFLAAALAMNRRAQRERRELEQLRADLERRVEERTRELTDANRRLGEASRTDALTGLLNRRGFVEEVEREARRTGRDGADAALVLLDLDGFKRVNDEAGHLAGDAVLVAVAAALRESIRERDIAARWGGEEMILLLPETDREGAVRVAEKVRAAIAAIPAARLPAALPEGGVTASFGVATHPRGARLESSVAHADAALYRAKAAGRDRVEVDAGAA